jgi:hypothetical protein
MEIAKAVTVGVKRFKKQSHRGVFRAVTDQHQCAEAHAILDIARCPTTSQVSIAEVGTGNDRVGAFQAQRIVGDPSVEMQNAMITLSAGAWHRHTGITWHVGYPTYARRPFE